MTKLKNGLDTNAIKALMLEKGINQKELAEQLGMTKASVCRFISGKQHPKNGTVIKIADALGVMPERILLDGKDGADAYRNALQLVQNYSGRWTYYERLKLIEKLMG